MAMRAARPGVFSLPVVSSLAVRQVSQPQNMKIDRDRPAVKAAKDFTANGFSHDHEKSADVAKSPLVPFRTAIATNRARTTSWSPTNAYWRPFVVVIPR